MYNARALVAKRFHEFCKAKGIVADKRMPHGILQAFLKDHIVWRDPSNRRKGQDISRWYKEWRSHSCNVLAAVAEEAN